MTSLPLSSNDDEEKYFEGKCLVTWEHSFVAHKLDKREDTAKLRLGEMIVKTIQLVTARHNGNIEFSIWEWNQEWAGFIYYPTVTHVCGAA